MKKKNLIMTLAVVATMGMVLTGCGGDKPDKVTVDVQKEQETSTEVANPENQPLIDEDATQVAEIEPATDTVEVEIKENGETVSDEQVAVGDYLSEHGIVVTPCGEMTVTMARMNSDELVDTTVVTNIEVVPSSEEGYSDTIFTAKIDVAATSHNFNSTWAVYDRYTGQDLQGLGEDHVYVDQGGSNTAVGVVTVNGKEYDCTVTFDADTSNSDFWKVTMTVHHPSEYDGVVFEAGKHTASMQKLKDTIDDSVVSKIADYPELIEDHLFFTASDK